MNRTDRVLHNPDRSCATYMSHCPLLTCETRFKYKTICERIMPKSGRATAPGFLLRHERARPRQEE
jgi:hypothetical protein